MELEVRRRNKFRIRTHKHPQLGRCHRQWTRLEQQVLKTFHSGHNRSTNEKLKKSGEHDVRTCRGATDKAVAESSRKNDACGTRSALRLRSLCRGVCVTHPLLSFQKRSSREYSATGFLPSDGTHFEFVDDRASWLRRPVHRSARDTYQRKNHAPPS